MAVNYPYTTPYPTNNMMPMNQPYNQMVQQDYRQISPIQQQFGLKGRPVSSLEEVRGTTIDFDGSVFYFPDIANKRIYTKQINLDGTATLQMYELKQMPLQSINSDYVTHQELESVLNELKNVILRQQVPQNIQQQSNNGQQLSQSQQQLSQSQQVQQMNNSIQQEPLTF